MMSRSTRVHRVESEMLQILSLHLQQSMAAPLPCYASITAIEAQGDLRTARVYFRLVGEKPAVEGAKKILNHERGGFQRRIAKDLKTKFCPVLKFEYGVAPANPEEDHIERLLENLRQTKRFED